jgi:hypothetical protein
MTRPTNGFEVAVVVGFAAVLERDDVVDVGVFASRPQRSQQPPARRRTLARTRFHFSVL